jgi:hypothetical protein
VSCSLPNTDGRRYSQPWRRPAIEMSFEARREISNEQVQNETSDRNATLLTSPINTIRSGIGHAGRFDGDVVGTGSLFKGGSSSKIDQPVDPANQYTQRSFSCRAAAPRSMRIFPLNKGGGAEATMVARRRWSRSAWGLSIWPLETVRTTP